TVARIRNIALVAVSILAVIAGWLYWTAAQQRKVAEEQKEQADHILLGATNIIENIIEKLHGQLGIDTQKEVFAVFKTGADHGDAPWMGYLGRMYQNVRAWVEMTPRRASGPRRPLERATRSACLYSASFTTTVLA